MRNRFPAFESGLKWALMLGVTVVGLPRMAAEVPAVLPSPDTTPPSSGKVKVYISPATVRAAGEKE